ELAEESRLVAGTIEAKLDTTDAGEEADDLQAAPGRGLLTGAWRDELQGGDARLRATSGARSPSPCGPRHPPPPPVVDRRARLVSHFVERGMGHVNSCRE